MIKLFILLYLLLGIVLGMHELGYLVFADDVGTLSLSLRFPEMITPPKF